MLHAAIGNRTRTPLMRFGPRQWCLSRRPRNHSLTGTPPTTCQRGDPTNSRSSLQPAIAVALARRAVVDWLQRFASGSSRPEEPSTRPVARTSDSAFAPANGSSIAKKRTLLHRPLRIVATVASLYLTTFASWLGTMRPLYSIDVSRFSRRSTS